MPDLTDADLLDTWERGREISPGERGLLMFAIADPCTAVDALGARSVGQRDAALLELRGRMFGPRLDGLASCPRCGEVAEIEISVDEIVVPSAPTTVGPLTVVHDGFRVSFRVPSTADMAALARHDGGSDPVRWLFGRCVVDVDRAGTPLRFEDLPDAVLSVVADAMAEVDPQADIELALTCPSCARPWRAVFDIVSFLWRELDEWAARLLRDVQALATEFGWSEPQILALTPWRRRHYVEMIGA